jgi:hypothetical protein
MYWFSLFYIVFIVITNLTMQKYGVFFCEIFTKNTVVFTNCRKVAWAIFYAKI